MQSYTFKKARDKDLDEFFVLFSKLTKKQFPEYSKRIRDFFVKKEYNLEAIRAQVKSREIIIYLALSKGEVAAYLMVRPLVGGVSLGVWLAVSEAHQRKGLATKLLEVWAEDAKKEGMHKLHLWTGKTNVEFYKKRGFKLVGRIPKNYYGADDYLFYKSIQKPLEKNYLR